MMKRNILNGFVWIWAITSCTSDVGFHYNVKERKLVLDCVFANNAPISAYISTNSFILDTSVVRVENALILLYENEQLVDTLRHQENGFYQSACYPKVQTSYRIEVFAEGYEPVYAKDTLPNDHFSAQILSFQKHVTTMEAIRMDLLSLRITDSNPGLDFYELELRESTVFSNGHVQYADLFYLSNSAISVKSWEAPTVRTILFNDETFNNGTIDMDIFVKTNEKIPPIVKLRKVSRQYYAFKTTLYYHHYNKLTNRDDLDEIFKGEPVEMFSNIESGYGIFAGYVEVEIK